MREKIVDLLEGDIDKLSDKIIDLLEDDIEQICDETIQDFLQARLKTRYPNLYKAKYKRTSDE